MSRPDRAAGPRLRREPALDGIRAVAVLGMLVYHQRVSWFPGGFLTVSTFFTLSGFLITRLLLAEHAQNGRLDLGRFYVRRARRLLPLAVLAVVAVTAVWVSLGRAVDRGDAVASLAYVENWWLLIAGRDYGELFRAASPFQHFWSLAIEEQFYIAFPVLLLGVLTVTRRQSVRVGVVVLGAAACATLAGVLARGDLSRAYYGTDARAAELLLGAALAMAWSTPRGRRALVTAAGGRFGRVAAPGVLVALALLWSQVRLTSGWLFPWAALLNATLTVALVVACSTPGPTRRALGTRPLAGLGRISYGVYVVHWPVYLLLTAEVLGLAAPAVFAVRVAVTVAIAAAVFVVLEEPVRVGRRWRGPVLPVVLGTGAVVAAALTVFAPQEERFDLVVDAVAMTDQREAMSVLAAALPEMERSSPSGSGELVTLFGVSPMTSAARQEMKAAPPPAPGPTGAPGTSAVPPRRVLMLGDSISWGLALGYVPWARDRGVDVAVFPAAECGIGGSTPIVFLGERRDRTPHCEMWHADLGHVAALVDPEVVLVAGGWADLADRQLPDGRWTHIGDPAYDAWLLERMRAVVETVTAGGARIGWLTLPHLRPGFQPGASYEPPFPEASDERVQRYNELILRLAGDERVDVADLAAWARNRSGGEFDRAFRPDGVHIDSRVTTDVLTWLEQVAVDVGRGEPVAGERVRWVRIA